MARQSLVPFPVPRYEGELLGSLCIRAARLGMPCSWGNSVTSTPTGDYPTLRYYGAYVRMEDEIGERPSLEIVADGTPWPLLALLIGGDFPSTIRDGRYTFSVQQREKTVRFCPPCAREQRNLTGTSWWVRDQNLPHVVACPTHVTVLHEVPRIKVMSRGGFMPHEMLEQAVPVSERVTDDALRQCLAVKLLAHYANDIDTAVFKALIDEYATRFRSIDELRARVRDASRTVHVRLQEGGKATNEHNGISKMATIDGQLALFAACTSSPQDDIARLKRLSVVSRPVPQHVDSLAVEEVVRRYRERQSIYMVDIDELLKRIVTRYQPSSHKDMAHWISENIIAITLLSKLDPKWLESFLKKCKCDDVVRTKMQRIMRDVWYFIYYWCVNHQANWYELERTFRFHGARNLSTLSKVF